MYDSLDRVSASMYVSEVRDLVGALVFQLDQIDKARAEWLVHEEAATAQARTQSDEFDVTKFNRALQNSGYQQSVIFDAFEALLAAWARLSLLFFPISGRGDLGKWRAARGDALREIFALPDNTLLGNRDFRDSWMHFDERMDQAVLEGWLGNRQQFVRTAGVANAVEHAVRVIDVEGLVFHYRTRTRTREEISLDAVSSVVQGLEAEMAKLGPRIALLPARAIQGVKPSSRGLP